VEDEHTAQLAGHATQELPSADGAYPAAHEHAPLVTF